jgi:hypothetical protein
MIPTRLKARLPRQLSYPVGAEAISEALAGAPHVEAFSVTFWDEAVWPASEFRRLLLERLPYKVMTAEYQPTRKPGISASDHMVQIGWYDEKWELSVYPVRSEFRQLANRLLREVGLPAIVTWLRSSGRAGWSANWHRIELVFSPADGSIASQESNGV